MSYSLNRDSHIPLYKQLKNELIEMIKNQLKPGQAIPTEGEIEKLFQVSRITVRRAIESLVDDGIVVKQQGRGTFVKSTEIIQKVGGITSWTEEMRLKGKKTETHGLEVSEIRKPSKRLIDDLQLKPKETVICVKRVRSVDEEPTAIMLNYLRAKMIPGFLEKGLQSESLYEELEKNYGIQIDRATEWVRAREVSELEANALNISPYSPVLHLRRISFVHEVPFEIVEMIVRADRYQYTIELAGRNKLKIFDEPISKE